MATINHDSIWSWKCFKCTLSTNWNELVINTRYQFYICQFEINVTLTIVVCFILFSLFSISLSIWNNTVAKCLPIKWAQSLSTRFFFLLFFTIYLYAFCIMWHVIDRTGVVPNSLLNFLKKKKKFLHCINWTDYNNWLEKTCNATGNNRFIILKWSFCKSTYLR